MGCVDLKIVASQSTTQSFLNWGNEVIMTIQRRELAQGITKTTSSISTSVFPESMIGLRAILPQFHGDIFGIWH